jgi:hypothetical protein
MDLDAHFLHISFISFKNHQNTLFPAISEFQLHITPMKSARFLPGTPALEQFPPCFGHFQQYFQPLLAYERIRFADHYPTRAHNNLMRILWPLDPAKRSKLSESRPQPSKNSAPKMVQFCNSFIINTKLLSN